MSKFIELHFQQNIQNAILVNVAHIQSITACEVGSQVMVGDRTPIWVRESYDEITTLLEAVGATI